MKPNEATIVCPRTKLPLRRVSYALAERVIGGGRPLARAGTGSEQGYTKPAMVLLRSDNQVAYPIIDDVPILLPPERLTAEANRTPIDTTSDPYREAYEEMAYYDAVAVKEAGDFERSPLYKPLKRAAAADPQTFPAPSDGWLDATYDCQAQWDAYNHLAPVRDCTVLQLGGRGSHAIKLLLAGASTAWLLTPMLGEARFARAAADYFGLGDRLKCIVGIAEEMPFSDGSFQRVYTGSCLHHTVTPQSIPQIARVLADGGRFAAVEPWRAPLYGLGVKLLGKRETAVQCIPMDRKRSEPLGEHFGWSAVMQHGALSRYALLAFYKLGMHLSLDQVWRITDLDDRLSNLVPALRRQGSSAALLAGRSSSIDNARAA